MVAARFRAEDVEHARVSPAEGQAHGVVVDALQGVQEPPRSGTRRHQLLVAQEVLVPEGEVVGGERVAVAPAQSGAQVHGELREVVVPVPAGGGVGGDRLQARVHHQQRLGARGPRLGAGGDRAERTVAQAAAVGADALQRHDHHRVGRHALLEGRQLAGLDQRGQHRRLLEAGDAVAGGLLVLGDGGEEVHHVRHQALDLGHRPGRRGGVGLGGGGGLLGAAACQRRPRRQRQPDGGGEQSSVDHLRFLLWSVPEPNCAAPVLSTKRPSRRRAALSRADQAVC